MRRRLLLQLQPTAQKTKTKSRPKTRPKTKTKTKLRPKPAKAKASGVINDKRADGVTSSGAGSVEDTDDVEGVSAGDGVAVGINESTPV